MAHWKSTDQDDFVHWQWGTVPEWVAAGSLLLAFRIFLKDRATADRAQVDLVGIWADRPASTADRVWVQMNVRNGSQQPIFGEALDFEPRSYWRLPDTGLGGSDDRAQLRKGTPEWRLVGDIGHLPPNSTWTRIMSLARWRLTLCPPMPDSLASSARLAVRVL